MQQLCYLFCFYKWVYSSFFNSSRILEIIHSNF